MGMLAAYRYDHSKVSLCCHTREMAVAILKDKFDQYA